MAESAANVRFSTRTGALRVIPAGGTAEDRPSREDSRIRAAAAAVLAEWEPQLNESFDAEEIRQVVEWLCGAISSASQAEDVPPPDGSIALTRFLLERFGSSLLAAFVSDSGAERSDILALSTGVDAVRQAIEPDWNRYFASQISGPDGLNLVLEVAHDLRSPLTSIRCLAETLERGQSGPVTDLQRRQLRLIYSASLGLGTMAADVIEMARRGDQLVDGEPVPFSVSEVIEAVVDMVRPIAEEKGLAFTYQTLATDQRVGVPHALSRILLNLVTNALKFTDQGSVEVQVRATGMSRVEFAVVDTGRGIPDDALPTLFRPFRRSPARAGRSGYLFSGTGLGLALCRKMLSALDSELRLETAEGTGTRFSFEVELPPTARL